MRKNKITIIIPVDEWWYEIKALYEQEHPHNHMEFLFEDFSEIVESIVNLTLSSIVQDSSGLYQYAYSVLGNYISKNLISNLLAKYELVIKIALENSNIPVLPTVHMQCRHWLTSNNELFIDWDSTLTTSSRPVDEFVGMSREEILASIQRGDYISERIRQQYGVY